MKAIQIEKVGGPEVLRVVDLPIPQPNEALVKVSASGMNFIDTYHREGRYIVPLPFILGQEGAGVVTQVGSEVKSIKPRDHVAWTSIPGRMPNSLPCLPNGSCRFQTESMTSKPRPPCCKV
jgi:NADPH2:quinone reductase